MNFKEIASFAYEGNDDMINLENEKIPKVHKNFKSMIILKNGDIISSPPKLWINKIWKWWYTERRNELIKQSNHMLIDVANSMLNQKHKIDYRDD